MAQSNGFDFGLEMRTTTIRFFRSKTILIQKNSHRIIPSLEKILLRSKSQISPKGPK